YRKPMLLVLDNCEQILPEVSAALELWRARAPNVRFLVTSRARLGLEAERTHEVGPLEVPSLVQMMRESAGALSRYSGVALFADRARAADPEFVLTATSARDVVAICIELDGMPLAIELAAARVKNISPSEIANNLGAKFDMLKSTKVELVPRQRTLTGAIEWSYGLLTDWEKEAFVQASAFRDGFSLEAAENVLDLSAFPDAPPILEVVQSLRENSLLRAHEVRQETRLDMYKAIREFGEQKLDDEASDDARAALHERHARFFLALADRWNHRIPGPRDVEALDRIETDLGNVRAVLDRALAAHDLRATARAALAMTKTMAVRFPPAQLVGVLEPALDVQEPGVADAVRLRVELTTAEMAAGDWDRADEQSAAAEAEARSLGLDDVLARALLRRGDISRNRGRIDEAAAAFTECAELARRSDDKWALAFATGGLGATAWHKGNLDEAWRCFEDGAALGRELGAHRIVARQLGNLGVLCEARGERETAIQYHREVEELARRKGDRTWVAMSLRNRGTATAQQGDFPGALRCYREGEQIARELGGKAQIAELLYCRGSIHSLEQDNAAARVCYEEAEALSRELGDRRQVAVLLGARAHLLYEEGKGDVDAALACHVEAEEIATEIGDKIIYALNRCYRGNIYLELERLDEAWELLSEGIQLYRDMRANRSVWFFKFAARASVLARRRGDARTADALRDEALEVADATGLKPDHPDPGVGDCLHTLGRE
ncbi:MAG: tetratricopeptide repeat protein, partial [Planctomycetota bacterium]|nr:tetratricopeptide repeat protein [Planctomycetota bacterium]